MIYYNTISSTFRKCKLIKLFSTFIIIQGGLVFFAYDFTNTKNLANRNNQRKNKLVESVFGLKVSVLKE